MSAHVYSHTSACMQWKMAQLVWDNYLATMQLQVTTDNYVYSPLYPHIPMHENGIQHSNILLMSLFRL